MTLLLSGCQREDEVIFNIDFSINVGKPRRKFPKVKKLVQSKREVYELYGRPDFVRLWWTEDGRIHQYLEVDRRMKDRKSFREIKRSWVYLENNIEYLFDSDESFREIPLSEKIRTVCIYGDPENVKKMSDDETPLKETWNYYSIGLILKFENDKIVGRQRHTPMGNVINR